MKPTPAMMTRRLKPLPRHHRVAHLRALIRRHPAGSSRREELAALLRDEVTARLAHGSRTT